MVNRTNTPLELRPGVGGSLVMDRAYPRQLGSCLVCTPQCEKPQPWQDGQHGPPLNTHLLHSWIFSSPDDPGEAVCKEHTFSALLSLQKIFWGLSVATEVY